MGELGDCPDVLLSKHNNNNKIEIFSSYQLDVSTVSAVHPHTTYIHFDSLILRTCLQFRMVVGGGTRLVGGIVSVFLVFTFSLSSLSPQSLGGDFRRPNYFYTPDLKIILLWNSFFDDPSYGFRYH